MKQTKFYAKNPEQCFPGEPGWDFLPDGYTGKSYGRVVRCFTRYRVVDNKPARITEAEAIQDALRIAREWGVTGQWGVKTPDGDWKMFNL